MAYPLEAGEVMLEVCISRWNSMCQPYIESTAVLSDYCRSSEASETLSSLIN